MSVQATHQDNIVITIGVDPLPTTDQKFTSMLYMRDGISLNALDVKTYTSGTEADTDETAGYIDATTTAAIKAALTQGILRVKVGRVDVVGGDTYIIALNRILVTDCDFWAITTDLRVDATIATFVAAVAALETTFRGFVIFQSADADWKTAGIPAAYTAIASLKRWAVVYHDTAAEIDDVRWAASKARWNPDTQSAPWDGALSGGTNLAADPSSTEKINLDGNYANHALPYGTLARWIDGGWAGDGSFVYERLTIDWFHDRLLQDIVLQKSIYDARGRKWTIDDIGRAVFRSLIEGRFAKGVSAKHFQLGQTTVTIEPISTADLADGKIRATGQATFLTRARLFQVDLVFGRALVNVTE